MTVAAIGEATVQVLLAHGSEHLTTTRVAARAGVSVGTLYQYYPDKQALLFAVLEKHLSQVAEAVEAACVTLHGQPLPSMVAAVVNAFVDAKMARADISVALYSIASNFGGEALARKLTLRGRTALKAMLLTAPGTHFDDLEFAVTMLFATMAGTTRAVLEAGAPPRMVRQLRTGLVQMCLGYLDCDA